MRTFEDGGKKVVHYDKQEALGAIGFEGKTQAPILSFELWLLLTNGHKFQFVEVVSGSW